MSRPFSTRVAMGALMLALTGPVLAQETAPAATGTGAAPEQSQPAIPLPKILQDARLSDVTQKTGPRGDSRIRGTLPEGVQIEAMVDPEGELRGVRARDDAALPPALVAQLVPQAVRDNAIAAEIGRVQAVFSDPRGVMLAGRDAADNKVRAGFSLDGSLLRFARGEVEGPGFREEKGPRHDHRHGKGRHGDRWADEDGPGAPPPPPPPPPGDEFAPPPPPPGEAPPPPPPADAAETGAAPAPQAAVIDQGKVRAALTAAGYTSVGEITQDGPRTMAQAVNPEGETVTVELNPDGEVLREVNR